MLVAIGIALIAVELVLIPGFGVAGLLGGIAFFAGLYISLIGQGATTGDFVRAGLVLLGSLFTIVVGAAAILTAVAQQAGLGRARAADLAAEGQRAAEQRLALPVRPVTQRCRLRRTGTSRCSASGV